MAWLCIDAGTSVIKAILIDETGRELTTARQSVPLARPHPAHAEQDMRSVWDAVVAVSHAITQQNLAAVDGIATTAQGDGCWLVDSAGEPVGPAILWNDGRAHEVIEKWRSDGVIAEAFRTSGSVAYPGLPNAIWRWLEAYDPQLLKRARWSLTCNGWLYFKMTGEIAADLSDASNPFCDIVKRRYSPELLRLYGVEEHTHLLPEIAREQPPSGALLRDAAQALGVRAGIRVVMAPYDIVSTAAGTGCLTEGEGCLILGTTACPEVITSEPGRNGAPAGTTIALYSDSLYLRAMPTLTGCEALDWAAATLRAESVEDLSCMAARASAGSNGAVCVPYFSPAGERSPFLAPSAKASFLGLSLTHTREDLARSAFEGLSFAIRECFSAASTAPLSRITICGGGSRSDFWCQMIADVCGCEVLRPNTSEAGARGAFFYATGCAGCNVVGRLYEPRPGVYDDLFQRFQKLRDIVISTWQI
ncbi:MAG TPA: FGGY-family carbohydrate kinase [Bryobacteraceae bacterium]|jgi:xylulokinase|nr:FGGY-family carbohydrate kinase [Bryobacteraceae bacterium]